MTTQKFRVRIDFDVEVSDLEPLQHLAHELITQWAQAQLTTGGTIETAPEFDSPEQAADFLAQNPRSAVTGGCVAIFMRAAAAFRMSLTNVNAEVL